MNCKPCPQFPQHLKVTLKQHLFIFISSLPPGNSYFLVKYANHKLTEKSEGRYSLVKPEKDSDLPHTVT